MAKKSKNNIKNKRANYYDDGGSVEEVQASGVSPWAQALSGAAGMLPGMLEGFNQGDSSSAEAAIARQRAMIPSSNSNAGLMSEWSNYRPMGRVSMDDLGAQGGGQIIGNALSSGLSGAASGASLGVPGAIAGAVVGLGGSLFSGLFGRNKVRKQRDSLNKQVDQANQFASRSFDNKIGTLDQQQGLNMASNYFQGGGVLHSGGSEFGNGLTFIGEGGTHEQNPFGGVQVGMDQEGIPNLLEEGEAKFENYVFSDSLKPDKETLKSMNLKESYSGKTFAEIAEILGKESEERPNDPISKTGLLDSMAKLTLAQEDYKMKNNLIEEDIQPNIFRGGGDLVSGPGRQYLNTPAPAATALNIPQYSDIDLNTYQPSTQRVGNPQVRIDGSQVLRYAPVLGSALSVAGDMLGWQNTRDYTHADTLRHQPVSVNPVGNYMSYTPLDRNYYANQLRSAAAANRSAIANQAGGNRATAVAGLLASDQNAIGQLGALGRQAEEYNLAQRMQVEDFNRRTNMFNTEAAIRADMFNTEGQYRASADRARMRQSVDDQVSQARSMNLSGLFDNLGEVGREAYLRNMINTNPAWRYGVSGKGKVAFSGKNGGKLMTSF